MPGNLRRYNWHTRCNRATRATISKMEHRADLYLSTLRSYIEAMGGNLEIRAAFPDMEIVVTQFQQLEPGKRNQRSAEPQEQILVRA